MALEVRELLRRPRPDLDVPRGSISGQAGLVTAGTLVQGLVRFAYPILIGNLFAAGVVGKVSSAISLAMLLTQLWPTSAANAASKYIGAARGAGQPERARIVVRYLVKSMALAAVVLVIFALVFGWRPVDLPLGTLLTVPLLTLAYSGYIFVRGVQFGTGRAATAASWDLLTAVPTLGLLALVVFAGWAWALLLPLTIGYGVYTVMSWPKLSHTNDRRLTKDERSEIFGFVSWGALSQLGSAATLQVSMVLTNLFDSKTMVDQYAGALALATPTAMLVGALYQVLFPSVSSAHSAGDSSLVKIRVDAATRALVVALTGVLGMIALVAGPVMSILYPGNDWPAAPEILRLLVPAVLLTNLGAPSVIHLSGTTRRGIKIIAIANAVAMVTAIAVVFALSPALGVYGSALGYLSGGVIVSVVPIVLVWRSAHMHWRGLWLRFGAGMVLLIAGIIACNRLDLGWWELAVSLGFGVCWLAISWPDIRRVAEVSPIVARVLGPLARKRP